MCLQQFFKKGKMVLLRVLSSLQYLLKRKLYRSLPSAKPRGKLIRNAAIRMQNTLPQGISPSSSSCCSSWRAPVPGAICQLPEPFCHRCPNKTFVASKSTWSSCRFFVLRPGKQLDPSSSQWSKRFVIWGPYKSLWAHLPSGWVDLDEHGSKSSVI